MKLPELPATAVKRGLSLTFGPKKMVSAEPLVIESPIQLRYTNTPGLPGLVLMEIPDLGRMYEIQSFITAFEIGYNVAMERIVEEAKKHL